MLSLNRLSWRWRKLCLYICILSIALPILSIALIFVFFILPNNAVAEREFAYFSEIARLEELDSQSPWLAQMDLETEKAPPYNQRLLPLIHDITQLNSWDWQKQLNLYEDGTAEYPSQRFWLYVGGTAKTQRSGLGHMFTDQNGSCEDPPYICDSWNEGFNRLLEYYHTHGTTRTTKGVSYGFVDCDVSPMICEMWDIKPVMLVYLETKSPCTSEMDPFRFICSVKWTFVPLPLKKMPFPRKEMIKGRLVPTFPSAYEQMKALVGYDGATEGLELTGLGDVFENIIDVETGTVISNGGGLLSSLGSVMKARHWLWSGTHSKEEEDYMYK